MVEYRAKPVVVEVVEYHPDRMDELLILAGEYACYNPPLTVGPSGSTGETILEDASESAFIVTLAGVMEVRPGDWIIKGPTGLLTTMPSEAFALAFELV